MHATEPQALPIDGNSVGARARSGDRDAMAELGRRGGIVRAQRERARKAAVAGAVTLATIDDRKGALEWAMGKLKSSGLDEARIATATAALVREFRAEAGIEEMAAELERLRGALANAQAMGGGDRVFTTSLGGGNRVQSVPAADPPGTAGGGAP